MSQVKKTFSFKSVGQKKEEIDQISANTVAVNPIGIKTPISFAQTGPSMFDMSYAIGDQISDNLKNLLLTNKGERLMLTDFGANLKELVYDLSSEDIINEALSRISTCVSKYMPYIELQTFEVSTEKIRDGYSIAQLIKIGYDVPTANLSNQKIQISMIVAG